MNKRHRVFIAINLPGDVKKYLASFEQKFSGLPAKWTPQENLHVTLVFLGDLTNEELGEVCVIAKEVAAGHAGFEMNFSNVGYGPAERALTPLSGVGRSIVPRFIWATGEKNKELSVLKNNLQEAFLEKINFKPEFKTFSPHVTLARISTFLWRQIEPEERPEVGEDINLNFLVESIEVMESEGGKNGPQYTIIESCNLNL
ncbi:MAG: 2'-5' RNA ligase [Candidatus Staskawiczbacteria bacterium RIFCSPHIGHO2_01_FULL_41_41]|uniref:RNA 2',3'-cyclic phosphodiesterase n=1 Tax=Candidatus Staskawiczbacteria bacterium RIFCSPHIGHO2_01_FULL_41_41 TaxID=1802203 RepID=A0A1G2HU71_9BACT|nr:MAG: 2'-5' RNA ligase [Candidatus Staskawiczbacteria bacterium RIFCSPHIGHO2_01_FULL_41_41]OGZ74407.1 MAG: 2'-5' RNA ligase [Candidatus Staskawiczbacteria bacterium RIFCSPLOWO2_01_FULL_43_17b]